MSGPVEIHLTDEQATARLAQTLAPWLAAGDTVLLDGPIGAGKTHFCRSLIQARLGQAEDVPSPTFTLVQTYQADVEIWHADLYRLTHPDEAQELGLEDAFATAICLVEWPDRLGRNLPANPIRISLSAVGEGRLARIDPGNRPDLSAALRDRACLSFLQRAGWHTARRDPLSGDASARRYERLYQGGATRLLMDAPPGQADSVQDFVRIDRHLLGIGLSAPRIDAEDMANGFLLIEDFGDSVFASLMRDDPETERPLYAAAVDALIHLQFHAPAGSIPALSTNDWAQSAAMVLDWYRFAVTGDRIDAAPLLMALNDHLSRLATLPPVMILRDFHAENLMWLPERADLQRVGLLDFQLAQMGQPGYDLVSLLQDARRDVAPEVETDMIRHFLTARSLTEAQFLPGYACLGALRALRILGIFARLCL
ncbi:MAG: tRNA (adenosine(37)-N6)-threonylcarbamoyltransferase complex ATPase subunit type 1 TsaE, partial [Candidatus Saccharibacteria bacterium]|nr:tRNA (adenosine(37)-N6)-threonylcarbamoyltransferase complex ATPase subunit type 1 TsaE [Pseudorhodobacter sp.]